MLRNWIIFSIMILVCMLGGPVLGVLFWGQPGGGFICGFIAAGFINLAYFTAGLGRPK